VATSEYIIKETLSLFKRMGIRSVTMDMVAEQLGISKRTLYELFPNKYDLLTACLNLDMEEMREKGKNTLSKGENILEKIVAVMYFHINALKQYSPIFIHDLKKYYPEISCKNTNNVRQNIFYKIVELIEIGKKEQVFRSDINSDISAKLLMEQFKLVQDESFFPSERYPYAVVFEHIAINFIRGIATIKGLELIDIYYKKYKNNEV